MLFYTGIVRTASNIAGSYVNNIDGRRRQLRILKDLVDESILVLSNGDDISNFGKLMREAWDSKRSLSNKVSNPEVDEMYDQALSAGAVGGKLTGAGGGGFMLLFAPPEAHSKIRRRLNKLIYVPFKFDFAGSQIIFFDSEEDYSDIEKDRSKQSIQSFQELSCGQM
jgi:D-glycero-alpha-D-manno-heptose-7-phosphate kinase